MARRGARPALRELVAASAIVLMSQEDPDLLFPGASDDEALRLAADLGPTAVVLKQGSAGAIGTDGDGVVAVAQPGDHAWSPEGIVSGVRGRRPG